jgi:hypothetical protein
MSVRHKSEAHRMAHDKLIEAFGPPGKSLDRDDHWALAPYAGGITINLLLNGSSDVPAVWVFDPHDENDGVSRGFVQTTGELAAMIQVIRDRLERARRKHDGHGQSVLGQS